MLTQHTMVTQSISIKNGKKKHFLKSDLVINLNNSCSHTTRVWETFNLFHDFESKLTRRFFLFFRTIIRYNQSQLR